MSKISAYKRNGILRSLIALSAILASQQVNAAAFALKEQSVTYLGNAFAGTASTAEDASTTYYNPAGLVELKNAQAVLSGTYIMARLKLNDATARNNIGTVVTGSTSAKPKSRGLVPGMFFSLPINSSYTFGFSVSAPFGLSTHYSNTDIARYMATDSKITVISYSPALSYKVNDNFSVGAGFDALDAKATLGSALNFGAEGYSINKAHGWSYGYHVGILYKPSAVTKMGLVYFSRFSVNVDGTVQTLNYPTTAPTRLISNVKLPDRLTYSVTHQYNNEWTAMGEVEWTHWSLFKSLNIQYNVSSPVAEHFFYKNTFRFSLGANYKYTDALMLKGGLSYEQSPVTLAYRSARLPDSNRYWLAFGAKYKVNKNLSIDGAYAHLFVKKAPIAQTGSISRTLNGNYKSSADIVGVQLTWNFV